MRLHLVLCFFSPATRDDRNNARRDNIGRVVLDRGQEGIQAALVQFVFTFRTHTPAGTVMPVALNAVLGPLPFSAETFIKVMGISMGVVGASSEPYLLFFLSILDTTTGVQRLEIQLLYVQKLPPNPHADNVVVCQRRGEHGTLDQSRACSFTSLRTNFLPRKLHGRDARF